MHSERNCWQVIFTVFVNSVYIYMSGQICDGVPYHEHKHNYCFTYSSAVDLCMCGLFGDLVSGFSELFRAILNSSTNFWPMSLWSPKAPPSNSVSFIELTLEFLFHFDVHYIGCFIFAFIYLMYIFSYADYACKSCNSESSI